MNDCIIKRNVGRPKKSETDKLVIVGGKIPLKMRRNIEEIAAYRRWTLSAAIRRACELLIEEEDKSAA